MKSLRTRGSQRLHRVRRQSTDIISSATIPQHMSLEESWATAEISNRQAPTNKGTATVIPWWTVLRWWIIQTGQKVPTGHFISNGSCNCQRSFWANLVTSSASGYPKSILHINSFLHMQEFRVVLLGYERRKNLSSGVRGVLVLQQFVAVEIQRVKQKQSQYWTVHFTISVYRH